MTEFFTHYGDHLQLVSFVNDPVFLAEPFIRTTNFEASDSECQFVGRVRTAADRR